MAAAAWQVVVVWRRCETSVLEAVGVTKNLLKKSAPIENSSPYPHYDSCNYCFSIRALPSGFRASGLSGSKFLDIASLDASALKTENGGVATIEDAGGLKTIKLTFPASKGYPGFEIPAPNGEWNLSDSSE